MVMVEEAGGLGIFFIWTRGAHRTAVTKLDFRVS